MRGGGRLLSSNLKGFTLAEVLVTLGIIGVVAAMTMPVLIANHKKNVAETKLKRSYNILSNVFVRAQVDFGDVINWDLANSINGEYNPESSKAVVNTFIKKFVLPYLADGYSYDDSMTPTDLGYKTEVKYRNGTRMMKNDAEKQTIRLQDGTYIFVNNTVIKRTGDDGEVKQYISGIMFVIDIDGPKGNNIVGKDVFIAELPLTNNASLHFFGSGYIKNNIYISDDITREELIDGCETDGKYCGCLIQSDGWQIKYKY